MWENLLNHLKWFATQKPKILMGFLFFASSFLYFFNCYESNLSKLELRLYGLLFFASSFLISHVVFVLFRWIKKQCFVPYRGNPPREAKKILKLFSDTRTDILSQQDILFNTKLSLLKFQYLIDQLHGRKFIEIYFTPGDPD
ncbi:MAG: hypothetical protein K8R68_04470, partial [Bacteroidales bacterium]|nr:hypothetical protein [Bacteroidales bacterium]